MIGAVGQREVVGRRGEGFFKGGRVGAAACYVDAGDAHDRGWIGDVIDGDLVVAELIHLELGRGGVLVEGELVVLGGSQALSRSLFSSMLPKNRSAEFFGFYAISSKFASIFGPLAFALLIDMTGSNRLAILALAFFFVVGIVLLLGVDVEQGRLQAES